MRDQVNPDVLVVAAGGYRPNHGQPEHNHLDQLVGPGKAETAIEQLAIDDLEDRHADHRAQQHEQRQVLGELPCPLEALQEFPQ